MSETKTLLQFLLDLLHDPQALADFRADPQGALHDAGLSNCTVDDIKELLPVVLEKVDPQKCAQYEDDCDSGHCHDDAPRHHEPHHGGHHHWSPDPHCGDDEGRHQHHDNEIDKVVTHLNYVTNNYNFVDNSHETIFNTTTVNNVWAAKGSTVDIINSTHNVAPGGVSIEGTNNAPVATGDHAIAGNGNLVSGDGSTTAFGTGSALSHVGANDGGAVSVNGPATGNSEHTNLQNYGNGNVTAATHAPATAANTDSHAHTTTTTDSNNHTLTTTDSHNHTDNSQHTEDSNNLDTSHSGNLEVDDNHLHLDLLAMH